MNNDRSHLYPVNIEKAVIGVSLLMPETLTDTVIRLERTRQGKIGEGGRWVVFGIGDLVEMSHDQSGGGG